MGTKTLLECNNLPVPHLALAVATQVIRMYRTLLGEAGFRKGMDLYFERHDGQAVSCDDFRAAMADANKVDLDQFERWYLQVRGAVTARGYTRGGR